MIKANELRIGNFIYEEVLGVVPVSEIKSGGSIWVEAKNITADKKENNQYYHLSPGNFHPVPINPEILLDCGFMTGIDGRWKMLEDDSFYIHGTNSYYIPYVIPELKYLHQLQNCYFAFIGKELEYKPW